PDIGRYCCMATVGRKDLMSQEGHIQLEGIPHFSVKPHDVTVVATVSLSLQIIWLQNGGPLNTIQDPVSHSPSTLNISGLNHTSSFSCEAHNSKGVATSASGTVPGPYQQEVTNSSLHISWEPGFGGVYPVSVCSIQAAPSGPDRNTLRNLLIHNQNVYVPPAQHLIPELKPYTFYDVSVACRSSHGASPWTPWVALHTAEGGKLYATIFYPQPISVYKMILLRFFFGSVLEGLLVHQQTVLKVAVKTMKISICTRTEMEDFLEEAACMKEFDHPNIMRQTGSLVTNVTERGGYPSPVFILPPCHPYMKHGDLHSFLLYSRLGDNPLSLPSQMLVKFIAWGMEYLSNKRDLAVLNEHMTVCVADYGRISKMPVKWIAIESLVDRLYTTKMVVATRGQTPYPGVENSEIYDYLSYFLMFSCWLLSPKDCPGFPSLRCDLEKALEEMPEQEEADYLLYVNMEEPSGSLLGAIGGWEPFGLPYPSYWKNMGNLETIQVHHHNHHDHAERYVLCPQHEAQPYLNDSVDSPQHKEKSMYSVTISHVVTPNDHSERERAKISNCPKCCTCI
uniref:Fibronectin type-III domain-containing protein n=1 Tax=Oncorhynchus tshawytscha TaxID=74940 RepID=A0A8C8JZW2_ONCTS